jgi:hypothetical protein
MTAQSVPLVPGQTIQLKQAHPHARPVLLVTMAPHWEQHLSWQLAQSVLQDHTVPPLQASHNASHALMEHMLLQVAALSVWHPLLATGQFPMKIHPLDQSPRHSALVEPTAQDRQARAAIAYQEHRPLPLVPLA